MSAMSVLRRVATKSFAQGVIRTHKFSTLPSLRNATSKASENIAAKTECHKKKRSLWLPVTLGLATGALFFGWYAKNKEEEIKYFEVNEHIKAFPNIVRPPDYPLQTSYSLLGLGVRSVTIVSFKVYAMGIYAATGDMKKIPKILNSTFIKETFIDLDPSYSHQQNVRNALNDPVKSVILVRNLLDGGVRMAAKFTPIKNTNLTFVREGIIKTLWNHPNAKVNEEALNNGVAELRTSFNKKGSFLKDDDLFMELNEDGSLQLTFISNKNCEVFKMDVVKEPIVGRFLFSQYMSGPKPLSIPCKDEITTTISNMI